MKSRPRITVSVLALVLASCSAGDSLPTLELSSAGSIRDAAKGEMANDSPVFAGGVITYEAGTEDWGDAAGAAAEKWPAWRFTAPTTAAERKTAMNRVAGALGLVGNVSFDKTNQTWMLVDKAADLTLQGSGDQNTLWWNVHGTSLRAAKDAMTPDCPPNAECAAPDVMITPTTIATGHVFGRGPAEEKGRQILADMGVDTSDDIVGNESLGWTTSQDSYGTYVSAVHMFRGAQTGMSWSFTFGADGVILSAAGPVFSIVRGDSYPVITVDAAIKRLNDGLGGVFGAVAMRGSTGAGGTEPVTLKVTAAAVSLVPWWMHDGGQMLLPAYDLTLDDGSHASVIAVTDKYVKFAGASSDDVPVDSGPGGGSTGSSGSSSGSSGSGAVDPVAPEPLPRVTNEQAKTLIGLTQAEAQKVCDENGWTLRIASVDGQENFLTMDWQTNRVNVALVKEVVTAVSIG